MRVDLATVSVRVKICGVTSVADAILAQDAGADAIGLNFVPSSPRCIDLELARRIRDRLVGSVEVIAVVADLDRAALQELADALEPSWLQLHGEEAPELLLRFLPRAYKAIRIGGASDVKRADAFAGERILVDAKVPGQLGGSGVAFDYSLTRELARRRRLFLAGGLTPESVAAAIAQVRPFGVDVASGVEVTGAPGRKDPDKLRAFVKAVRAARPASQNR